MRSNRRNTLSFDGTALGVIVSILFGVAAGFLFFGGMLPTIIFGAIGASVVALVALILFWVSLITKKPYTDTDCVCENFGLLLTGAIGTLITSFIVFSVTLVAASPIFAILIGVLVFFATLTLLGIVSYLDCLADCDDGCNCNLD